MLSRKKKETIPYRCSFCRIHLVTADFRRIDYLWLFVLFRPYRCPHCFICVSRPLAWIGRLWPFQPADRSPAQSKGVSQRNRRPVHVGARKGPLIRIVLKFGRWIGRCERIVEQAIVAVARFLWAVVSFIPNQLSGRGAYKSSGKFLKPRGKPSRQRSQDNSEVDKKKPPQQD